MIKVRCPLWATGMLLSFIGCASTPPGQLIGKGLPNFDRIDDHVYRGGQPLMIGFGELAGMNVGTVVDLREPGEKPPNRDAEKVAVKNAQIEYFAEPMKGVGAPSREAMRRVLSVLSDPDRKKPVFVHCQRGADRTGTVVAVYRIAHDCWTADRAIQEAREHGMSWLEFGMRRFIRGWYEELRTKSCEERRLSLTK